MEFTRSLVRHKVFAKHPVTIVDVGVSGGFEKHWHEFGSQKIMYGFEARGVPSMRTAPYEGKHYIFPVALSDIDGQREFYVTAKRHASSFYKPFSHYVNRFHGWENLEILEPRMLDVRDLYSFSKEHDLLPFDFMKLDCEGAELDVLIGMRGRLDSVVGVSVEALFQKWRDGQPTFRDVDRFMIGQGFKLFTFTHYSVQKRCVPKQGRSTSGKMGQVLWGQFIYLRDIMDDMEKGKFYDSYQILKTACYLEIYNLRDCVIELLQYAVHHKVDFGFNIAPFIGGL